MTRRGYALDRARLAYAIHVIGLIDRDDTRIAAMAYADDIALEYEADQSGDPEAARIAAAYAAGEST